MPSLIDDGDEEPREFGCEADYYLALDLPYQPKNGVAVGDHRKNLLSGE